MQTPACYLHSMICMTIVLGKWGTLSIYREQPSVLAWPKYICQSATISWQILSKYSNLIHYFCCCLLVTLILREQMLFQEQHPTWSPEQKPLQRKALVVVLLALLEYWRKVSCFAIHCIIFSMVDQIF